MATTSDRLICDIPVFYATTEGQTLRIAERLAEVLHQHGFACQPIDVAGDSVSRLDWARVRGAMVGASLHQGRHQKEADRFVRAHAADLNNVPSAFFSVSLATASKNQSDVQEAARLAREFPDTRGWKPAIVASIAGRLAYSKYNFLIRFIMKRIAKKEGAPTDTSRDYEMTDWGEVDRLAHDFAARVHSRAA